MKGNAKNDVITPKITYVVSGDKTSCFADNVQRCAVSMVVDNEEMIGTRGLDSAHSVTFLKYIEITKRAFPPPSRKLDTLQVIHRSCLQTKT